MKSQTYLYGGSNKIKAIKSIGSYLIDKYSDLAYAKAI